MVLEMNKKKDFYAPYCNERRGMINWFVAFKDSRGGYRIFVLEKMKDSYHAQVMPVENFTSVISKKNVLDREQSMHNLIEPKFIKTNGKKGLIFTITNLDHFKSKLNDDSFVNMARNPNTAFQAINTLVQEGILKKENEENQPTTLIDTLKKGEEKGKRRSLNLWCENTMKKAIPTPEIT